MKTRSTIILIALALGTIRTDCLGQEASPTPKPKSTADAISDLMANGKFAADSFYLLSIGITESSELVNHSYSGDSDVYQPTYCQAVLGKNGILFKKPPKEFFDASGNLKFGDNALGLQNLIKTDHHTIAVPVGVAKGLADSFLAGLIARLYSAELFDIVVPNSVSAKEAFPLLTVPDAQHLSADTFKIKIPNEDADLLAFSNLNTYITDTKQGKVVPVNLNDKNINPATPFISEKIWAPRFARAQRGLNFKLSEMLAGWKYGCQVLADSNKDELVDDLKILIVQRFKPRDCWKITAYVLTYLDGWSEGMDQVSKTTQPNPQAFNDPPETVLESLESADEPSLAVELYRRLVVIATGLSLDAAAAPADTKASAGPIAIQFQDCVAAYSDGIDSALPELFTDAYNLGFENGYQSGFMDGYAAAATAAAAKGEQYVKQNSGEGSIAYNIQHVFDGATPTLEGAISLAKDVAKVWSGDLSPITKQVDKAKNWVKKTFGIHL